MSKRIDYSERQSRFYDVNPPLVPWPKVLKNLGFSVTYKPREVFWKKALDSLEIKAGERVLDVGCGQGLFLARLTKTYKAKGVGIDVSKKSVEFARKNYTRKNLSYRVADAAKIPYDANSFDIVVSFDTLEHIADQEKAVEEMLRVLKPGGRLLIYTLNCNDRFTLDWIREKLGFDIYSRAGHRRELFVNPTWLRNALRAAGARNIKLEYYDAFFSLALNEAIMAFILICKKIGLFSCEFIGGIFLFFSNLISRVFYSTTRILDYPWLKRGCSLGFTVIAEK